METNLRYPGKVGGTQKTECCFKMSHLFDKFVYFDLFTVYCKTDLNEFLQWLLHD